jgi:enterochelin esterase family protein
MPGDQYTSYFTALQDGGPRFRLVWLACGTDDRLIQSHRRFEHWMREKGVSFISKETAGAHTWMVWRRYLTDLVPLLFRKVKR